MPSHLVRWTSEDCLRYATSVGSGTNELHFSTENTSGVEQCVVPTMPVVLGFNRDVYSVIGPFDWSGLVHAEQVVTLHQPLPIEGAGVATTQVAAIEDKGKAAIAQFDTVVVDSASGQPLFTCATSVYIRGAGGWGGEPTQRRRVPMPDRQPEAVVTFDTRPEQALLYRLNGDRNPLHSDPGFARRAGFDRPILHGLCTFGFAARAVLGVCDPFGARLKQISTRFAAPVYPGQQLHTRIWREAAADDRVLFETVTSDGVTVLSDGQCVFDRADEDAV